MGFLEILSSPSAELPTPRYKTNAGFSGLKKGHVQFRNSVTHIQKAMIHDIKQ